MKPRMKVLILGLIVVAVFVAAFLSYSYFTNDTFKGVIVRTKVIDNIPKTKYSKVKITAVGDCTIGWDDNFSYKGRFDYYLKKNDNNYGYYLNNVKDIFKDDDITIANLEGTFTDYNVKVVKAWNFKAPKDYRQVLTLGNVDIVSIANNHTYDYGKQGYNDTVHALKEINMPFYGNEHYLVKEVNGIKIGFFGFLDIYGQKFSEVDKAINYLKEQKCDLIIASMHWGIERDYEQSSEQVKMGHYLIDNGVDLVIGHHPHVIQGIEKYNNKYIIYSLANFSFGGNQNPKDKDTYIWQITYSFIDNELQPNDEINIIPARVSSVTNVNNYQPTPLEGAEYTRVLNKIKKYSKGVVFE